MLLLLWSRSRRERRGGCADLHRRRDTLPDDSDGGKRGRSAASRWSCRALRQESTKRREEKCSGGAPDRRPALANHSLVAVAQRRPAAIAMYLSPRMIAHPRRCWLVQRGGGAGV